MPLFNPSSRLFSSIIFHQTLYWFKFSKYFGFLWYHYNAKMPVSLHLCKDANLHTQNLQWHVPHVKTTNCLDTLDCNFFLKGLTAIFAGMWDSIGVIQKLIIRLNFLKKKENVRPDEQITQFCFFYRLNCIMRHRKANAQEWLRWPDVGNKF